MITSYGYSINKLELTEQKIKDIKSELTVKSELICQDYGPPEPSYPVYRQNQKSIYVPRWWGICNNKFAESKIHDGLPICSSNSIFSGTLRKEQEEIVEKTMEAYEKVGGGIISLYCGGGKTTIAINIIAQIKRKTLIVVHNEFLMDQWESRINQFLPDAKIGRIRQAVFDIENKDIVLCMIQSVVRREYPRELRTDFGHIIIDETHHVATRVFSNFFYKVQTKYMLGLSATPHRKDGLGKVLIWFFGPIIVDIKRKIGKPMIKYINTDVSSFEEKFNRRGNINIPTMISDLINCEKRNKLLMDTIQKLVSENRKILMLSDRVIHCTNFERWLNEINISSGRYIGGMKSEQREESCTKQVILGTFKMASEGFDCPGLDTLILATPKSDIEQAVGRILRKHHDHEPLVVDLVDRYSIFKNQKSKRNSFYKKNGYYIENLANQELSFNNNTIKKYYKESEQGNIKSICLFKDE